MPVLCDFLFGLLTVSEQILHDFKRSDYWRKPIDLSLTIFLRSDIFSHIINNARERDKLIYTRITWEDSELLLRVLEQRFLPYCSSYPNDIWTKYFCPTVKGIKTRDYLISCILPRPRDLIYFTKAAIENSVNRGHTKILEDDVLTGEKKYSQYALDSLLVENGIRIKNFEDMLYEFAFSNEIITDQDIFGAMRVCHINEEELDYVINTLFELTFIGMEVAEGRYDYLYNEENKGKIQAMARKETERSPKRARRFRINRPFHAYLEIQPSQDISTLTLPLSL